MALNTTYNKRVSLSLYVRIRFRTLYLKNKWIEQIEWDTKLVIYECKMPLYTVRFRNVVNEHL